MSDALGADVASARIHIDDNAAQLAADHDATAVTVGQDIAFGADAYHPGSPEGDALLAHELAHTVQQKAADPAGTIGGESAAAEVNADRAAAGAVAQLHGGAPEADAKPAIEPTGLQLQRTPGKGGGKPPAPAPADPFLAKLHAKLNAKPRDLDGFYGEIAALAGGKAGDAGVRAAIVAFIAASVLSQKEAFRAICFQEFGPIASWPLPVKNYADGIDKGTYTLVGLPPSGPDVLREFCVRKAAESADGAGTVTADYRNAFNAKFEGAGYSALSIDFDPALDSKGPRTPRARKIFTDLYADVRYKNAYDKDTPPGFRGLCDTTVGPDGTNLIASPRLQALRASLSGATVNAANTADAKYTTLAGAVKPKAEALDARDRQEIDRNHSWRLAVDAKVQGLTDADSQAMRDDLWSVVTTSRAAAPVAPAAPAGPAPPVVAPPVPNAAQSAFLGSIHLSAPASPSNATTADHPLTFQVKGSANPGLVVNRRVVVEPAAQVTSGQDDEKPWANGAASADSSVKVDPQPSAPPSTVFTAKLTMPPLVAATFPEQSASVTVVDKRLDWFKTNLAPGLKFVDDTDSTVVAKNGKAHYTGKQCPIEVTPDLGGNSNPRLNVQIEGELKKAGVVVKPIVRQPFGQTAPSVALLQTILVEPTPAPATPEKWELVLRAFDGAGAAAFQTITHPFTIAKSRAGNIASDAKHMKDDNAWLNRPIGTAGTLLHHMKGKGGHHARVAGAVAGGALKVAACFMRSDSADQVDADKLAGTTTADAQSTLVAYAMGVVDPLGVQTNTLLAQPGAAGWRWGGQPGTVFLNVSPHPGGPRRTLDDLGDFLAHEGIHAADRDSGAPGEWDSYATEFRAYWIMGVGSGESTAFDPTMDALGPKSPRARAIFAQVYGSSTYPTFKPAYDANTDGFRERVDNYLFPDGINLTLSPQLADLRKAIESFAAGLGAFAAAKPGIVAKFAACPAGDKKEVSNNRDWRDLVESKFAGADRDDIKTSLGIAR